MLRLLLITFHVLFVAIVVDAFSSVGLNLNGPVFQSSGPCKSTSNDIMNTEDFSYPTVVQTTIERLKSFSQNLMKPEGRKMYYHSEKPIKERISSDDHDKLKEFKKQGFHDTIIALLYLRGGELDSAHEIVQYQSIPESLYIHAFLHRLEGHTIGELSMSGFSNSCYWWNHTPEQEMFEIMYKFGEELSRGNEYLESFMSTMDPGHWNPEEFVWLCSSCAADETDSDVHEFCVKMTEKEWESLFNICYLKYGQA